MTEQNCSTGCANPNHMVECFNCGTKYHFGIIHQCPTSVILIPESIKTEIKYWNKTSANDWEEAEDELRKLGRKSVRIQGKYKGRGKTKRREP